MAPLAVSPRVWRKWRRREGERRAWPHEGGGGQGLCLPTSVVRLIVWQHKPQSPDPGDSPPCSFILLSAEGGEQARCASRKEGCECGRLVTCSGGGRPCLKTGSWRTGRDVVDVDKFQGCGCRTARTRRPSDVR